MIGVVRARTGFDRRRDGQYMERDMLLAAWRNGVPLADAWLVFAEEPKKESYFAHESEGLHLDSQRALKEDFVDRLYAGQFRAIGVENTSGGGPNYIAKYYFLKTAKIDWDKSVVAALGKEFYHVVVESERELAGEAPTESGFVDRQPIQSQRELEPVREPLPSEPPPARERPMGRPPLVPQVCEVIRELMDRDAFTDLDKWEIERLIQRKARERFPTSFPKPDRPTTNTINKALRLEGWPPPPK